jgi:hypothetical protein
MTRRRRRQWDRLQDRWAAGEPLSADEEARRQAQSAVDPVARRELDVLASMTGLLDRSEADAADHALVERVLEGAGVAAPNKILYLPRRGSKVGPAVSAVDVRPSRGTIRRSAFAGIAAVAAVIATVYAGLSFKHGRPEMTSLRSPALPEAEARLVSASGEVQIESSSAPTSERAVGSEIARASARVLHTGDHVRTGKGSACLRVQPTIDVCLGPDSDVEIGSLRAPETQIVVARGIAVAALAPRAAGQTFALVGGDVVAVAHGTVYALDRTSAVNVDVVVLEGTVAVHAPGRADVPDMIPAHTRWRRQPTMRSALRPEEEASFAALLAPRATTAQAATRMPPVEDAPRPVLRGVDSPDNCLARARAALNRGNKRAALDWYHRLRDRFPNDEAARTVLVTSGRLEMDLGVPTHALDDFQAYLRGGDGALRVEALAGTARALRALGRVDDERRAIDRYLALFPNGFDAPLLRSRLAELEEPSRAHAIDSPR